HGKAGGQRPRPGGDRHHNHGNLRHDGGRDLSGHGRSSRRRHPPQAALHRLLRGSRHGQFRRARHGAGEVSRAPLLSPQSADHPDADDAGGKRGDGPLDRRAPEPHGGARPFLPAGRRRVRARCPRPALPRSSGGPGAFRGAGTHGAADQHPPADPASLQHQRPGLRGRSGAGLPCPARRWPLPEKKTRSVKMKPTRSAILQRFRAMIERGEPIIGGGAGTGLSAKCEEAGGIDLIVIYNSGRYRMAGRGSLAGLLAYGDANQIVVEMAREVLPVVKHTPVLAGVNGTDPFRDMDVFLDELKRLGFAGVQNFPTVGLIDGTFRANLEETGMSYALEVDMIAKARARDLLTTPYVFNAGEAEAMAWAGADIVVCHMGLTTGGSIGAETALKLEDCPKLVDEWAEAALSVNPDIMVLVHGGPVANPEDAEFVLRNTRTCHGFYGASSMERLPTEVALTEQTRRFKQIRGKRDAGSA